MKQFVLFLFSILVLSCSIDDEDKSQIPNGDYKQLMRDFVIGISKYTKAQNPSFIIVPQNGIELASKNGEDITAPHTEYLNAVDANGQEDLLYGYDSDNQPTPDETITYLKGFLNLSKSSGKMILVTDYCTGNVNMDDAYSKNKISGFVSFAADHRELNNIPSYPTPIYAENNSMITSITQVNNFLYLINPESYATRAAFIAAVTSTNYDLLIMDLYFNDGSSFTSPEIELLRSKANGGKRLVISYMSIGEAENYRYYWQSSWNSSKPVWMEAENPDWPGNFKVKYWQTEWQNIIYGNDNCYAKKIINAGFDGVYLDIIDAFEYFE
ncbi:MAG: endo alpha-1,4 polygalactosaminidase [Chryseolinea sp.]